MVVVRKIFRKIYYFFKKPIPVFVFHQVSENFDDRIHRASDWISTSDFKKNIFCLKKKYIFISLDQAIEHLSKKSLRLKNYAVLTSDDGYLSTLSILSFLEQEQIPCTFFINSAYADKKSYSIVNAQTLYKSLPEVIQVEPCLQGKEYLLCIKDILNKTNLDAVISQLYLSLEQIYSIKNSLFTIGMHGYEHLDSTRLTKSDLCKNIQENYEQLKSHPCFIPYFAFPWGKTTSEINGVVRGMNFIPVLCDGNLNYKFKDTLSRISFESINTNKFCK